MRALILTVLLTATATSAMADDEAMAIVLSNAEHTLWHEASHLMVTELELPVIGQEEDAADSFATLMMMEAEDEDRVERLLDVAELWIVSHERDEADGIAPAYYGEHDLDAQRGLRVVCFLAGESPERAEGLLDNWGVPEDRAESCEFDYQLAVDGWDTLLQPHLQGDTPGQSITVRYGQGGAWEQILRETEMLEFVAETLDASFRLPEGLVMEAALCDEANAYWDPEARTVTLCYELLDDFEDLARQAIASRQ